MATPLTEMKKDYHIRLVTMDKLEGLGLVKTTTEIYYPDKATITPAGREYLEKMEVQG